MARWRAFAGFLLVLGIVLLPLRAVAATIPSAITYDAVVRPVATMLLVGLDAVRSAAQPRRSDGFECAWARCSNASHPTVVASTGRGHAYDDACNLAAHCELGAGVIYDAPAVTTAAKGGQGGNGPKTTAHGAERIAGPGATTGGVLSADQIAAVRVSGNTLRQADGATVRVLEATAGRFNVVIEGERGIITTFENLSQRSLDRLAQNYGWVQP